MDWERVGDYEDIVYESAEGIAKITINRPEVRNAFRPTTLFELSHAFEAARDDPTIGVVILTGAGDKAFCSGGDQRVRGDDGYRDEHGVGRLNVLDLQIQIRRLPKPVVAMVAGYAIGGGHVLHLVCDLTVAADNARFGQSGPKVGSFDGGYGAGLLARIVGLKKAREIWYLCEQYDAEEAVRMGLVNKVVPLAELEDATVAWAKRILEMSPLAIRLLKAAFNADTDGLAGIQQLAGDATMLYYMSEEAQEGRNAYLERRRPRFDRFPKRPWRFGPGHAQGGGAHLARGGKAPHPRRGCHAGRRRDGGSGATDPVAGTGCARRRPRVADRGQLRKRPLRREQRCRHPRASRAAACRRREPRDA